MRVFSTITLVLLPMSVVSTVFSTDIVDFQPGSGGGFAGNWSGPGALWWAATTVLVTLLVSGAAVMAGKDESWGWTTRVYRVVNDARVRAGPYKHAIRVARTRVAGFLRRAVPARESAASDSGPPRRLVAKQPEVSETIASLEGGEVRGEGYKEASVVEQGMSVSYSPKEVVTIEG